MSCSTPGKDMTVGVNSVIPMLTESPCDVNDKGGCAVVWRWDDLSSSTWAFSSDDVPDLRSNRTSLPESPRRIQNYKSTSPPSGAILPDERHTCPPSPRRPISRPPNASHVRWLTASHHVPFCGAHSLVMAPLVLLAKRSIATLTSTSSSSSKSPSSM